MGVHSFNDEGMTVLLIPGSGKDVKQHILCLPQMISLLGLPRQETSLQGIFEHRHQALPYPMCPRNLATLLVSLCVLNTHVHICTQMHMFNTHTPKQRNKNNVNDENHVLLFSEDLKSQNISECFDF